MDHPAFLHHSTFKNVFPSKPINIFKLRLRLRSVESGLKSDHVNLNLGSLYTRPKPIAAKVYGRFLRYNPNNLGNWSREDLPVEGTERIEKEVIDQLIDLYHGSKSKIEGYVTSGGTEGNIYCLWLGRSYLEQFCGKSKICLLKTSLTHYSISKAGYICNIKQFLIPLNSEEWNMDAEELYSKVTSLIKEGFRGFAIPLTLGYTATGTQDNIIKILKIVKKLRSENLGINIYIWIDAALNGLTEPFVNVNFKPFQNKEINAIVVDFHKFGLVPYSAGVVLYKKHLAKLIEKPVDYLKQSDCTLLGSRQGASAIAIWTMINYMGKSSYRKEVLRQLENKRVFLKEIKKLFPDADIITNSSSISCGIIFHGIKEKRLPNYISEKYWLYSKESMMLMKGGIKKRLFIYKFFFLPHVTKKTISSFISDIKLLKA